MKYFTPKPSDAQNLIGKTKQRKHSFQRLPDIYKNSIRKEVWDLSENNAGVSIQMITDSKHLNLRWSIKLDFRMNHMTDAGIKGLDVYEYVNNQWKYLSTGLPNSNENEHSIKSVSYTHLTLPTICSV